MRFVLISIAATALAASHSGVGVPLRVPRASPTPLLNALELRGGGMVPADVHSTPCPSLAHARITSAHHHCASPARRSHTIYARSPLDHAAAARAIVPALQTYTKASAIIYAIYALQFFAIPEKFISDHFEGPVDAMHVFLARGSGLAIAGVAYAMYKLDVPLKLLVAYNAMVGLVYPWNAAYISKLPVKYPMHYLPEVLMAGLTVAGVLAL